ncbi:HlyD family secretion protein [Stenotrophomonas thermophila]|nr:Secretion protein HlyD family protein [Stenotrophomonas maltophilia]
MSALFRREAIDARRDSWLGTISVSQPLKLWVLMLISLAAAIGIISIGWFGEYSKRSRVTGQLVPDLGLATVVAPSGGLVSSVAVEEGGSVRSGAALVLMSIPRAIASGEDSLDVVQKQMTIRQNELSESMKAQSSQIILQRTGLLDREQGLAREIANLDLEIGTRREQVRIGNEVLGRYRQLVGQQYVSIVQLNQQEQSVLELTNAMQVLERQKIALSRELSDVRQSIHEIPFRQRALSAGANGDLAQLRQEQVQTRAGGEVLVRAPVAGLIASRLVEPGKSVVAGEPLLSLLPEGSMLQAQLLVPSSGIGFVREGDLVLLRYQAYPYQKFGAHEGRVLKISRSAISSAEASVSEPVYKVLVSLRSQTVQAYGLQEPLRPGMRVDADIVGDRRKIYEWVLEPLYSVSGRLFGAS